MSNQDKAPESYSLKLWRKLFCNTEADDLSESFLGRLTQKLYAPYATTVLLVLAIILFWYEAALGKYVPILSSSWLPPIMIILALLLADKSKININRPIFWYLGLLILALFSAVFAAGRGLDSGMLVLGWFVYAVFSIVILASQSVEHKELVLKVLFGALVPSALLGLWQVYSKVGLFMPANETVGRAVGSFTNPNVFGMVLVLGILIGLYIFWQNKTYRYAFGIAPMLLALLFTGSRTSWLALMVGLAIAVVMIRPKWLKYSPLALLVLLIPAIRNRVSDLFSGQYHYESSVDGRIWTATNGLSIARQYPLLGTGPGSFGGKLAEAYGSPVALLGLQNGYRAIATTDNSYIQMLVQLGILGVLVFIGFVASVFTTLWNSDNRFKSLALASFGALLVMGLFANVLEFNAVALPVALILGLGFSAEANQA